MRNQIAAAKRMGVHAVRIASDNQDKWRFVEEQLQRDDIDILLIFPERLGNEHFRTEVLARIAERITLLVIDEARRISDWGVRFQTPLSADRTNCQHPPAQSKAARDDRDRE